MKPIPGGHQNIGHSDIKAVEGVLKSDWLTQGPNVAAFESNLAKYCGAKYAVAVSNGTAALHLAYLAAGIGPGDEVITTPNTFVATSNMILAVGAKPVFADIRLDTYNIEDLQIEGLISPKTKAISVVHFAGCPAAMSAILKIAKEHNLVVIEDAAHALGAVYKNKKIGPLGDLATLSFHPVKTITTGEGGAILTNNVERYKKMLTLRSHGIHKDERGFNVMTEFGYNYRITDFQSALGSSQLKRSSGFLAKRRKIAKIYQKALGSNPHIILPFEPTDVKSVWHLYVIRVKEPADRMPLYTFLKENKIGVNFHYPPVYSHPYYREHGFADVRLRNADLYAKTAITLPLFVDLKREDVDYIARTIEKYFEKQAIKA